MEATQINTGLFKTVPLYPTKFKLDIWVCDNLDNLAKYFNKRYGGSVEYYNEEIDPNQVCSIESAENSQLNGQRIIVMNINSFDLPVIVHELNHVIYHLAKYCNIEINYDSQEWTSYLLEYLFEHCQYDETFLSCDKIF